MGEDERAVRAKRGANLLIKMLAMFLVPMVVLVFFAVLALRSVGNKTADQLVEKELFAVQYMIGDRLQDAEGGALRIADGQVYKGDVALSGENGLLTSIKENTGIDTVVFMGATMVAASLDGDASGTVISGKITDRVYAGESVYTDSVKLCGVWCRAYFLPLRVTKTSSPVGMIVVAVREKETKAIYSRIINSNIIFMIVLVMLFCASTVLVVLLIVRALLAVVGNLGKVADGELNLKISERLLKRSDEVGKIARAVHSVIVSFSQTICGVVGSMKDMNECTTQFSENFDSITQSIDNVNVAVMEIAEGATRQAADTQTVGESMNDMGEAISRTTASVSELSNSAAVMKKNNEMVDDTLKELRNISERTSRSVDEVQRQTSLTNESVQAIRSATDIIAGIASQTNLLSLNASIEAARAGDMGRGFAVVAEEIRGLADQSKESADQIRGIVETLIQNSNRSVEIMDGVVGEIAQQNEKLGVTQNAFESLNGEVLRVVEAIDEISRQIDSIENYKNGVIESIDGLSEISQNNAASTQETAATMDQLGRIVAECKTATGDLVRISNELTENAKKFKL